MRSKYYCRPVSNETPRFTRVRLNTDNPPRKYFARDSKTDYREYQQRCAFEHEGSKSGHYSYGDRLHTLVPWPRFRHGYAVPHSDQRNLARSPPPRRGSIVTLFSHPLPYRSRPVERKGGSVVQPVLYARGLNKRYGGRHSVVSSRILFEEKECINHQGKSRKDDR